MPELLIDVFFPYTIF